MSLLAPATAVPVVTITLAGGELAPELSAALTAVRVRREVCAPAACALSFEVADAAALESALAPGTAVEARVDGAAAPLFVGEVLVLERRFRPDATVEVVARCQDRSHRLRTSSQLRVLVDVSVADLVRELAAAAGLEVDATTQGPRLDRVVQDGRSGMELVTAIARRAGLWWQVDPDGGCLRLFGDDGTGQQATVALGQEVIEASVTSSAVTAHGGWRVLGWDPASGDVTDGSASSRTSSGEAMIAEQGMLAGSERAEALARGLTADDDAGAQVIHALVHGDSALAPGHVLTLAGTTPGADRPYLVMVADHRLDTATGYTCTVTSAPPAHLRLRETRSRADGEAASVTVGEVVRVDDPRGLGRVRIALSAYDGVESEWMPVLALGAGEGKGLAVQPDVGDRVVLAHDAGDPCRGIVLGSLRTSDGGEPSVGVVDGAVGSYGLRLPTGQLLRISGAADSVVLANAAGSRIELSETGVVVHAEGDLVLEAPGRVMRLRAGSIEMEKA